MKLRQDPTFTWSHLFSWVYKDISFTDRQNVSMHLYVSVLPGFLSSVCSRPDGVTVSVPRLVCRASMLCPDKTSTLSTTNRSQAALQQKHCSNHLHVPRGIAAWQFQLESAGFLHFPPQPTVLAEMFHCGILVWLMSNTKEAKGLFKEQTK